MRLQIQKDEVTRKDLWQKARLSGLRTEQLGFADTLALQQAIMSPEVVGRFLYLPLRTNTTEYIGAAGVVIDGRLLDVKFHFMLPQYKKVFPLLLSEIGIYAFEHYCTAVQVPCLTGSAYEWERMTLQGYAHPDRDITGLPVSRFMIEVSQLFTPSPSDFVRRDRLNAEY